MRYLEWNCIKRFGFYCIFLNQLDCGTVLYGRSSYDYREGTIIFIGPGQVAGAEDWPYAAAMVGLDIAAPILLTLDTTEGFSFSFGSGMGALIVALVLGEQFVALGWLAATMALGFVAYGFVKSFIAFCGCLFID